MNTENCKTLTVVVPTLNSAATLDWTLASLSASCVIRVIVADSFSTDNTLEICTRWGVEVISVPPGNMYTAINAGLRLADSDWLAYVNSDDWVFTASYVKMLGVARQGSADIVYGSADYVDAGGRFLFSSTPSSGPVAARFFQAGIMGFTQPAAIFRRTVFEALSGFDERYRAAADFEFFCRASRMKFIFHRFKLPPVAAFRLHQGQISAATDWSPQEKAQMKERLHLRLNVRDRFSFFLWRISNVPGYLARILRSYELSGKFGVQKSTVPPSHE